MSTTVTSFATVTWTLENGHRHVVDRKETVPDKKHVELTPEYQIALRRGDKCRCAELRRQWQAGTFGRYRSRVLTDAQKAARVENMKKALAARMERKRAEKAAWNEAMKRRLEHEGVKGKKG
jgi:uncharacterized membrane-anchored protein YjiN (DUF445 family)